MQYKKHPIDRALEALVPILAPSFTLRSFRDAERLPKKYPLIDYAIVGSASKEYDKNKNLWRTSYFVVLEILVQERKPLDWCQFSELADAQDRNALFLSLEVIVEQLLVLLTNPKAVTPLIRPLDMIYSDLDFKLEGNPTGQYLHEHGTDKLTGVAVNFTISCLDNEGGACCLIDFNNADQVQALQALTEPGSVTWNLLANQGGNPPITPCDKIKMQLTDVLLLNCILPLYDFSNAATQSALSSQQILDLKTWLLPQYDFGDAFWQNLLTMQQEIDLTFYLLPNVDFSDPLIQAIITTQQKTDIINWLLPLVDFSNPTIQALLTTQQKKDLKLVIVPQLDFTIGFDDDFNLFNPTQKTDLTTRLCGASGQQYSMLFDGLNESVNCYNIAACNFTNLQPFTITSWVKSANYGGAIQGIVTKRSGAAGGTGWTFFFLNGDLYCLIQNGIFYINMRTNGVTFTNNTWYHVALTVSGSGTSTGVKFYANGLQLPTNTIQDNLNASIANTAAVMVGNEEALSMPFNGNIGYSRVFNIEFSPAQVVTDYSGNGGKMWEESPEIANQVFGWKSGQDALFGSPLADYWFFPNELDNTQKAPYSNNIEKIKRTTDVPV